MNNNTEIEKNQQTQHVRRIQTLPIILANQIAAGEVVERPASVLKEILENSLDAGSTAIEITLEKGGTRLIKVQDNGVGICQEDLELALSPHATSKISTLADLEGVISYGFRGEALASISAVSRLQLSSCVFDQETGFSIRREGRENHFTLIPTSKRQGTCIEVKDLFFNTPARRKFLKSEKTELSYLEEVFKRIALSKPQVAFKFQVDDRPQKHLPVCKSFEAQTRRVASLCGKSFVEAASYIEVESNGLKLSGWLGSEKALRAQADLQYFYVNGRIVRDKVVSHAVRQAYEKICLPGRYPAYVLYFELDPTTVDVNVHPTKHEVRFREARTVHAFISYAIQEGLNYKQSDKLDKEEKKSEEKREFSFNRSRADFWENRPLFLDFGGGPEVINKQINTSIETKASIEVLKFGKLLTILENELLLTENRGDLIIINIKKLQKEMLYRTLLKAYHHEGIPKRLLLIPKSLTIGPLIEKMNTSLLDWDRLGFEWNQVGETSILIRAIPEIFAGTIDNLHELLQKLLVQQNIEACIQVVANHQAESFEMSLEEANKLLVQFHTLNFEIDGLPDFYRRVSIEELKSFIFN